MGLVDRRPVVCLTIAMGFWVPLQYVCNNFSFATGIFCTVIFTAFHSSQRPESDNESVLDDSQREQSQSLGQVMAEGV